MIMKTTAQKTCSFSGCKCSAQNFIQTQFGDNRILALCNDHSPEWVKNGLKNSPITSMFGIKKSWYKLAN